MKPVLFMSEENWRLYQAGVKACPVELDFAVAEAMTSPMEIRPDKYCPTWGPPAPMPPWWARWFLRAKPRPPERVVFVVEMP